MADDNKLIASLLLALSWIPISSSATTGEGVSICYNYSCSKQTQVTFSESRLAVLRDLLSASSDGKQERETLAQVIGRLYAWAGETTPIANDRGGNYPADAGMEGRMDCIDHSKTTTRLLRMLEARGWLKFHRVLNPILRRRFIFAEHRSAVIAETTSQQRFVVDSWFVDNGKAAVVLPLKAWLNGGGPD
jgi:hypothetical protein